MHGRQKDTKRGHKPFLLAAAAAAGKGLCPLTRDRVGERAAPGGERWQLFRGDPMIHAKALLVLIAPFVLAGTARGAAQYQATDIGSLGGRETLGLAINNNGDVAGSSQLPPPAPNSLGVAHPFLYTRSGGIKDLGLLPGRVEGRATDLNINGEVVGQMGFTNGFVYSGGVLAPVPVPAASQGTPAYGINDAGTVVGSVYREGGLGNTIFTYAGGVLTERPAPRALATAYDISNSGYILADYSREYPPGDHYPVGLIWSPAGQLTELRAPRGWKSLIAAGINEQGHVVGIVGRFPTDFVEHPFMFRDGQIIDLGLPAGYSVAWVADVNEADQVVGNYQKGFQSPYRAFLYSDGRYTDLTSAVTLPGGFSITNAAAINDVGQIVVHAINARNETRTFLLTPVPEPAAGAAVVVAGAMTLARRRRRPIAPRAAFKFKCLAFGRDAKLSRALLLSALFFMFASAIPSVAAEYRVVELQPRPFTHPDAMAISGGNVAGNGNNPFTHALMWDNRGQVIDLHPQRFVMSWANDIDGNRVVGYGGSDNPNHALLWSGTAASVIDLHPRGAQFSEALAIHGTQVVGRGGRIEPFHALMWPDGTPGNVVDLNPEGYELSGATATTGTRQGGYGWLNGGPRVLHPLLWSGTPDSFIDLLPPGGFGGGVSAMSGEQQVGAVGFGDENSLVSHAMLWTGTAASAMDLHPAAGFTQTYADDTNGRQQVGYGQGNVTGGMEHALLWNGDNVVQDLHGFLPAGAVRSFAEGIDDDGTIVGYAIFAGESTRAFLWVPVPEPAACALFLLPAALLSRRTRAAFGRDGVRARALLLSALFFMFASTTPTVAAEYRTVELQTGSRSIHARAQAISGGIVAGNANVPNTHAVMWNDVERPFTDLNPRGFVGSYAEDIDGSLVVGHGGVSATHALLWSGTAASVIDLHPTGAQFSEAFGIHGSQVVGRGGKLEPFHALMWPDGTPGNVVDLNPEGYEFSGAIATTGTRQGGYGSLIGGHGVGRPLLWTGTPDSVVELFPAGPTGGLIEAMAGDQQVGEVGFVGGSGSHATLWTGTAESAVDLHPAGYTRTIAADTNGRQQVGYGQGSVTGSMDHALLWNGSNVVLDLHRFLPAGAVASFASGIDDDGTIVGSATFADQSARPVMWVPVPDPANCAIFLLPAALLCRRTRTAPRERSETCTS